MDCLRNSPDFNPIENLWSGMKMELKDDHISEEAGTLQPRRLRICMDSKELMTKY
jgi:hypothetical protein